MVIFIIPDINLPPLPLCLFLTYVVCCVEIKSGRSFLSFSERAFDIIFKSTFDKEMSLQFYMKLLSLSFFSMNLMIACL